MSLTDYSLVPITELEAVNVLLHAVGIASVMSLTAADLDDNAAYAVQCLSNASKEIQSRGWHFNEEVDYVLSPDSGGIIRLPSNCTSLVLAPRSRAINATQRGTQLYDVGRKTSVFLAPVYVNMILLFDFADLPQPIRWLVVAVAGKVFGTHKAPDMNTYRFQGKVESDAWVAADNFNQDSRDVTLLEGNEHFYKSGSRR